MSESADSPEPAPARTRVRRPAGRAAARPVSDTRTVTPLDRAAALERPPVGTVALVFDAPDAQHRADDDRIYENVSALAIDGTRLYCSCDENATLERLDLDRSSGRAGGHTSFALSRLFDLPDGPAGEIDIEGLAIDGGYLWITGSHALKRKKPDKGLARLKRVKWDGNRGFLGRVALADIDRLMDKGTGGTTARDDEAERAALSLKDTPKTELRRMLAKDPILGPFMKLPSKENGFDIEGLAVRGEDVLLGLRGPVVAGFALIVRLRITLDRKGRLKLAKLPGGARYALQALDLAGQGIRDLHWTGDDLLLLSGATTKLEALQSVYRIAGYDPTREVYEGEACSRVLDFRPVRGADHAEGIAVLDGDDAAAQRLLVVYDAPHPDRIDRKRHALRADLFDLPAAAAATAPPPEA